MEGKQPPPQRAHALPDYLSKLGDRILEAGIEKDTQSSYHSQ
jgi:hypothetical protein